jgi:alpha-beta hydrolase superfamily lysophospholipase
VAILTTEPGAQKPLWRQTLLSLLKALAIALVAFTVWIVACQSSLVYFPSRQLDAVPADSGMSYEDVHFKAADGVGLHGWIVPAEDERGAVLLCHGNGGNISHRLDLISLFHRLDLTVLAFDYRGYGKSEGDPDEEGTYLDAEAAWRQLVDVRSMASSKIVVYGRSLGGAICSRVAVEHSPGALVLDSTFTSITDAGQEIYPFLPVGLLSRFEYATIENVKRVGCPVLVIHSKDDELIPFHHGQDLFDAAPEPKRLIGVKGGHNENFSVSYEAYRDGLLAFLNTHI